MQYIRYPKEEDIPALITRPHFDHTALTDTVRGVLNDVRERGDSAVFDYEEQFDHVRLDSLQVSEKELAENKALFEDKTFVISYSVKSAADEVRKRLIDEIGIDEKKICAGIFDWRNNQNNTSIANF